MSDTTDGVTVDSPTTTPELETKPDQETETTTVSETGEPSAIPYGRFKEVNDTAKERAEKIAELEARIKGMEENQSPAQPEAEELQKAREQIRALGFITKEEQEQALRQKEEDARLEQELDRLEREYDGKDGSPKFSRKEVIDFALKRGIPNPKDAFELLKRKEMTDWHIAQAIKNSSGIKSEQSDGSGSSQSGTTDADLKEAIRRGDKNALHTFLKRISKS